MANDDPVAVVAAWVAAANAQDVGSLLALSSPEIEIVGPRGSGHGHQLLRDWLERAGLTLETRRIFARGPAVVVEQQGIWRSLDSAAVTGSKGIASAFQVTGGRVTRFARYDELVEALRAAELSVLDEIPPAGAL